jgi:hypothetical protein
MSSAPTSIAFDTLTSFVGGDAGGWVIERIARVRGPSLPSVAKLDVTEGLLARSPPSPTWVLRGAAGPEQYTTQEEREALGRRQPPLGLPAASRAALIPITKSEEWWRLSQAERRTMLEETSHHITIGMEYLPAVARRLYRGRDLGESFDFLTWFEFAPEREDAFEELVRRLRMTPEWAYVVREIDIRLKREG